MCWEFFDLTGLVHSEKSLVTSGNQPAAVTLSSRLWGPDVPRPAWAERGRRQSQEGDCPVSVCAGCAQTASGGCFGSWHLYKQSSDREMSITRWRKKLLFLQRLSGRCLFRGGRSYCWPRPSFWINLSSELRSPTIMGTVIFPITGLCIF